jgi:hypothetical protein
MTMESNRIRNQKMKILRFLVRRSYSSDGGTYGLMAPGSLAGAARLVLGRAKDLRGPNGLDDLRSPVGEWTSEGERTPLPPGENGGERAPSTAGDSMGDGANSTAGVVGITSRVFGRVSG